MVRNQQINILEKAGALFHKKGYQSTSMRDIAKRCGFEPGNIYNYFKNKEAILYEVMKSETGRLVSLVKDIATNESFTAEGKLRRLVKIHFDFTSKVNSGTRLIFDSESFHLTSQHRREIAVVRAIWEKTVGNVIREGIKNGEFADLDVKVVVIAIASIIIRSRIWFSPRGRLSAGEIGDTIAEFVISGLRGYGK